MEYTPAFQIRQPFQMVARRGPTSVVCLVRKVSLVGLRRLLRNEIVFLPLARLLHLTPALSLPGVNPCTQRAIDIKI
jgi:hypothetical protein